MSEGLSPLLKLAGFIALLWAGFHGALSLFPEAWTHDYDGLNSFGFVVGYLGAIVFAGLVVKGFEAQYGPRSDED